VDNPTHYLKLIMNPLYIAIKTIQVVAASTALLLLHKAGQDIKNSKSSWEDTDQHQEIEVEEWWMVHL
jgi:hypothetical protein